LIKEEIDMDRHLPVCGGVVSATCDYPALRRRLPDGEPPERALIKVTTSDGQPTLRKGLTSAVISPGRVTEDALEWYGYGSCHILAGALHEVSGWPLAVAVRLDDHGMWEHISHVGVTAPGGQFVDVAGARAYDEVLRQYAEHGAPDTIRETTVEFLTRFGQYRKPSWREYCNDVVEEALHLMAKTIISGVNLNPARSAT
jgi:hypothetical protein